MTFTLCTCALCSLAFVPFTLCFVPCVLVLSYLIPWVPVLLYFVLQVVFINLESKSEVKDVRAKIFERSEFIKTFVRVRLWKPYARNANKIGGHHARFGDKLCGRSC